MSFMIIPIRPMKCVGLTSSLTVLFVLLVTLFTTPVLLSFGKDKKAKAGVDGEGGTRMSHAMEKLNDFTFKYSKAIIAVFTVVCIALGIGLWKIEPAFDIEKTMGSMPSAPGVRTRVAPRARRRLRRSWLMVSGMVRTTL